MDDDDDDDDDADSGNKEGGNDDDETMDKVWYNVEGYYDDDNQDDGYRDYQDDEDDKTDDGRIEASELTTQSRYIQLPTNWFPLNSSQCVTQYITL